jgi:hypothetical protein
LSRGEGVSNRLDKDLLCELHTDTQPDIADLTNDIGVLGQKTYFLLLAESHFPQSMLHFGRGGKFFDAH